MKLNPVQLEKLNGLERKIIHRNNQFLRRVNLRRKMTHEHQRDCLMVKWNTANGELNFWEEVNRKVTEQ